MHEDVALTTYNLLKCNWQDSNKGTQQEPGQGVSEAPSKRRGSLKPFYYKTRCSVYFYMYVFSVSQFRAYKIDLFHTGM